MPQPRGSLPTSAECSLCPPPARLPFARGGYASYGTYVTGSVAWRHLHPIPIIKAGGLCFIAISPASFLALRRARLPQDGRRANTGERGRRPRGESTPSTRAEKTETQPKREPPGYPRMGGEGELRLRRVGKNKECRPSCDPSPRTRTVRPKHRTRRTRRSPSPGSLKNS